MDPVRSHFGRIEKDEVNIDAKANYVAGYIRSHKRMNFRELLENQKSRMDVIVTFLVVLELMKTGIVSVEQESMRMILSLPPGKPGGRAGIPWPDLAGGRCGGE